MPYKYILAVLVVCNFCGLDFQNQGRHEWHCKNRSNHCHRQQSKDILNSNHGESSLLNLTTIEVNVVCNTDHVKCCCGKQCKGLRGLKMQQRNCRVLKKDLDKELTYHIDYGNEPLDSAEDGRINDYIQDLPNIKLSVKLPKSESQWDEVNVYFKATLPVNEINSNNVNDCVSKINNTIYDYFQKAYGNIKNSDVYVYHDIKILANTI